MFVLLLCLVCCCVWSDAVTVRRPTDPTRVQAAFVDVELHGDGTLRDVATLLTTGRECVFRCTFCDLWQQTLTRSTPPGAIPRQLAAALPALSSAETVKLYNASNWFDSQAVPQSDWPAIAEHVRSFSRVVVENHPKLCTELVPRFRDLLGEAKLEVAIGLESLDPDVLPRLNKLMTEQDAASAIERLLRWNIDVRAFVLLPPPLRPRFDDAVVRTVRWAFDQGVSVVSLVPLREHQRPGSSHLLQPDGLQPTSLQPTFALFDEVRRAIPVALPQRLLIDEWDAADWCSPSEQLELTRWNRTQRLTPSRPLHEGTGSTE